MIGSVLWQNNPAFVASPTEKAGAFHGNRVYITKVFATCSVRDSNGKPTMKAQPNRGLVVNSPILAQLGARPKFFF